MSNLIKGVPGEGTNLAYKLTNKSVGTTNTDIAHGLPFTPTTIIITPKSTAGVIALVSIDATNITLVSSADTTCDIDVLG